jgi:hypothetical protein
MVADKPCPQLQPSLLFGSICLIVKKKMNCLFAYLGHVCLLATRKGLKILLIRMNTNSFFWTTMCQSWNTCQYGPGLKKMVVKSFGKFLKLWIAPSATEVIQSPWNMNFVKSAWGDLQVWVNGGQSKDRNKLLLLHWYVNNPDILKLCNYPTA